MSKEDLANFTIALIKGVVTQKDKERIREKVLELLEDKGVVEAMIEAGSK